MSEGANTGMSDGNSDWTPTFSLSDDGSSASVEIAKGEGARTFKVGDLPGLISKGIGYDKHTAKSAEEKKALESQLAEFKRKYEGYDSAFGRHVKAMQELGEDADLDSMLDAMYEIIQKKPGAGKPGQSSGNDWFADEEKPALTEEKVAELIQKTLRQEKDREASVAKVNQRMSAKFDELKVPDAVRDMMTDAALRAANQEGLSLEQAVENSWKLLSGAFAASSGDAEAAAEAARKLAGGNISKMGQQVGTTGDDPRRSAKLGSPEKRAYLKEKLAQIAAR